MYSYIHTKNDAWYTTYCTVLSALEKIRLRNASVTPTIPQRKAHIIIIIHNHHTIIIFSSVEARCVSCC